MHVEPAPGLPGSMLARAVMARGSKAKRLDEAPAEAKAGVEGSQYRHQLASAEYPT